MGDISPLADSVTSLFHELQQSALCAVHAANNILQGPVFTKEEFFSLARHLESMLAIKHCNKAGWFSIDVITAAIQSKGMTVIRWGSTETEPPNSTNL